MDARWSVGKMGLVSCTLLTLSLSGCILEDRNPYDDPDTRDFFREPFDYPSEPEALEYTYIRIGQEQHAGGPVYQGTLVFHYCIHNPNDFKVQKGGDGTFTKSWAPQMTENHA